MNLLQVIISSDQFYLPWPRPQRELSIFQPQRLNILKWSTGYVDIHRETFNCASAMQALGPEHDDSFDFLFKIILIGDSNVGKTCVVQNFKSGIFSEKQQNTIGVDFSVRTLDIEGKKVKVSTICRVYVLACVCAVDSLSPRVCWGGVSNIECKTLLYNQP